MKKILLIFSILVSSYIFLEVQNAKASVDELGYQVEYKTAENIDFDKSDVFVVLIEENRLDINKFIYSVFSILQLYPLHFVQIIYQNPSYLLHLKLQ